MDSGPVFSTYVIARPIRTEIASWTDQQSETGYSTFDQEQLLDTTADDQKSNQAVAGFDPGTLCSEVHALAH